MRQVSPHRNYKMSRSPRAAVFSWNINGLHAHADELQNMLVKLDMPPVICLQETKCKDFPPLAKYVCFGSSYSRSQHHGVALYVSERLMPTPIMLDTRLDGHVVAATFNETIVVSVYVKNSSDCDEYRQAFDGIFWSEMLRISALATNNFMLCGDFNACLELEDHHTLKKNEKVAGLKTYESNNLLKGLDRLGLIDAYMHLNPQHTHERWTFWSERYGASNLEPKPGKPSGNGWRLDYIFTKHVEFSSVCVLKTGRGDHSPLVGHV